MTAAQSGTSELFTFDVTIPAGTTQAAPQVTALGLPVRRVDRVSVRIPPGPGGDVGFRLASSGVQIIPVNSGAWFIGDGETPQWAFANLIESGAWQLIGYNTGQFPHTLQIRFETSLPYGPAPVTIVPADVTGLAGLLTADDQAALTAALDASGAGLDETE